MIIFTDECPMYLSVPGTHQNDRVWAQKRSKMDPIQKSNFAPKIMVWGTMAASGVSELHVLPQSKLKEQSITKRIFCLYFFLMIRIRPVILEKLQKEDL
jgi:hypothetical protein